MPRSSTHAAPRCQNQDYRRSGGARGGDDNTYYLWNVSVSNGRDLRPVSEMPLEKALFLVRPRKEEGITFEGIILWTLVSAKSISHARCSHPLGYRYNRDGELPDENDWTWESTSNLYSKKLTDGITKAGTEVFRSMEKRPGGPKFGTFVTHVEVKDIFKKGVSPEGDKDGYAFPFVMKEGKELPEDWHLPGVLSEDDLEHYEDDERGTMRKINPDIYIKV